MAKYDYVCPPDWKGYRLQSEDWITNFEEVEKGFQLLALQIENERYNFKLSNLLGARLHSQRQTRKISFALSLSSLYR